MPAGSRDVSSEQVRPPGWYPDPRRLAAERWWDGTSWTGVVNPPVDGGVARPDPVPARFVGGMNVPSSFGRLNVTLPLAVLTIAHGRLNLHPRPFPFPMFTDFEVPLSEIAAAFPLRGTLLTPGVGFELSDGLLAYFWTFRYQRAVLAALQQHGVRVDYLPRRAVGALTGQFGWLRPRRRSSPSVATVSGLRPRTVAFIPLIVIVGLATAVGVAASGAPWVASLLLVAGSILAAFLWQRHRRPPST